MGHMAESRRWGRMKKFIKLRQLVTLTLHYSLVVPVAEEEDLPFIRVI